MEEDWQRLADHVVTERVRRGLDLRSLAAETKVSERTLGKLESGQRVSRDTLAAIELAFDWPPGTCRGILLGGQSPAAPEQTQPPAKRNGDYPDWVAGDRFLQHIYDYDDPAGDAETIATEKLVAARAVLTHREATRGAHRATERRRA